MTEVDASQRGCRARKYSFFSPCLLWSLKPPKLPGFVSLPHCRTSPGVALSQSNHGIGAGAGPSSFFGDHRVLLQRQQQIKWVCADLDWVA